MRALECSGPWPSNPCGRRSDTLLCWPHLSAAATMNWSMITWPTLAKSPNCASQHDEGVAHDRVAVLEAERGVLREHGVVHHERRLVVGQVVERLVLVLVELVDEHAVTLAERAAPRVLTREAHRGALEHQRPVRQGLGERPVDLVTVELRPA